MASEPIICEQLPVEHVYSWGQEATIGWHTMIMWMFTAVDLPHTHFSLRGLHQLNH